MARIERSLRQEIGGGQMDDRYVERPGPASGLKRWVGGKFEPSPLSSVLELVMEKIEAKRHIGHTATSK